MPKTSRPRKQWVYAPKKPTPPKVPETLNREVETKANELVESVLKPRHIKEPEPDPQFNYIVDIHHQVVSQLLLLLLTLRMSRPLCALAVF